MIEELELFWGSFRILFGLYLCCSSYVYVGRVVGYVEGVVVEFEFCVVGCYYLGVC